MKYKKDNRQIWRGEHLGISFEINHWVDPPNVVEYRERQNWTYYIFLHLDRIPEQYKPNSFWLKPKKYGKRVSYDYYKHPVIGSLSFHCGCTWYSKEHGFDGSGKIIKIGCDYMHYWDEGKEYDIDDVILDVKETIEDFRNRVAEYKYWCSGNGKLYNAEHGRFKDGKFYSEEYWGDKDWFKELPTDEAEVQVSDTTMPLS